VYLSHLDLTRVLSRRKADTLCKLMGGVTTYLPATADARHAYAGILDMRELDMLCAAWGGQNVTIPNRSHMPRREEIEARLQAGASARDIALDLHVTERWVRYLAAALAHQRPRCVQGSLLDMLPAGVPAYLPDGDCLLQ
jgi:hypothetical protein